MARPPTEDVLPAVSGREDAGARHVDAADLIAVRGEHVAGVMHIELLDRDVLGRFAFLLVSVDRTPRELAIAVVSDEALGVAGEPHEIELRVEGAEADAELFGGRIELELHRLVTVPF
jgi:hypothetical protein